MLGTEGRKGDEGVLGVGPNVTIWGLEMNVKLVLGGPSGIGSDRNYM